MAVTVGTSDGRVLSLEGTAVTIGSSPSCGVPFPGTSLRPEHAVLRRMAGRWFVEAAEDCLVPATGGAPVRMVWVSAGDRVKLSTSGPEIVFEPGPLLGGQPTVSPAPAVANPPRAESVPPRVETLPLRGESLPTAPGWQSSGAEAAPVRSRETGGTPASAAPVRDVEAQAAPTSEPANAGTNPAIWALGGAALVLAGIVAGAVVLSMSNNRGASPPIAEQTPTSSVAAATSSPHSADHDSKPPPIRPASSKGQSEKSESAAELPASKTSQPLRGLYTVFVKHPEREELFRLGTAWAIDEHRLVTSGAIVQGLEELKSTAPLASVSCPEARTNLAIVSTTLHPIYKQSAAAAKAAQEASDVARLNLEQNKDEKRIEELTQAVVHAEEERFQALEKLVNYDVGLLEVKGSLPVQLKVAGQRGAVKAGTQIELLGVPFRVDEYLADPDSPATAAQQKGTVFSLVRSPTGPQQIQRLLLKFREDLVNDNWSGAPVVNSRGEVIAIYSRPTPPPVAAQQPGNATSGAFVATQDAVDIERVFDLLPGLR